MVNPEHPIAELLQRDKRYRFDAYVFVFEALQYAHEELGMGTAQESEPDSAPHDESAGANPQEAAGNHPLLSGDTASEEATDDELPQDIDDHLDDELEDDEQGPEDFTQQLDREVAEGILNNLDELGSLDEADDEEEDQRHVSGQELCQAIRLYAIQEYGFLAQSVLKHWGIANTGDFGEIVFNLIEIKQMRKTPQDCREDFEDVYDFDEAFQSSFQFSTADSKEEPRA